MDEGCGETIYVVGMGSGKSASLTHSLNEAIQYALICSYIH